MTRLLDLRRLRPGDVAEGTIRWTRRLSGRVLGIVQIEADMRDPLASRMRLTHAIGGPESTGLVALVATRPHLGGLRWWFACPITGRRTRFLYLPPCDRIFASRDAHRLGYRSQRVDQLGEVHARLARLHVKLGGQYRSFRQSPPPWPKRMRHVTYRRLVGEMAEARDAFVEVYLGGLRGLIVAEDTARGRRIGRGSAPDCPNDGRPP